VEKTVAVRIFFFGLLRRFFLPRSIALAKRFPNMVSNRHTGVSGGGAHYGGPSPSSVFRPDKPQLAYLPATPCFGREDLELYWPFQAQQPASCYSTSYLQPQWQFSHRWTAVPELWKPPSPDPYPKIFGIEGWRRCSSTGYDISSVIVVPIWNALQEVLVPNRMAGTRSDILLLTETRSARLSPSV